MRFFSHALQLFSVFAFASTIPLLTQDMAVRVEAVRLLDRAYAVSSSTKPLVVLQFDFRSRPKSDLPRRRSAPRKSLH